MIGKLVRTGLALLLLLSLGLVPQSTPEIEAQTGGLVWTTATLSQARSNIGATAVGTKALFAGGGPRETASAVVDIYDSVTGGWSTGSLSVARSIVAAATAGTKAIFAGGEPASGFSLATVDIYDSSTGSWSAGPNLSAARHQIGATTVGTKAFFAGGYNGSGKLNTVDIYDATNNAWSTSTLSVARDQVAAASVGTKALFAGGNLANNTNTTLVDIYDSAATGNPWSTANLSVARSYLAATSVGTKAFFAGGSWGVPSTRVDIYDNATDIWSTAELSVARSALAATALGTKAIFAGGAGNSATSNVVDIYDTETNTWSTTTLSQARYVLAATSVGGKALFAGGSPGSGLSNVVDIAREITGNTPIGISTSIQGITLTVQPGSIDFGAVALGGSKVSVQITATNASAGPEDFLLQGANATAAVSGESNWTLGPAPGTDIYTVGFGNTNSGSFGALTTNSSSLATNVAAAGTKSFFLQLKTPSSTTGNGVRNATVTVIAVAP